MVKVLLFSVTVVIGAVAGLYAQWGGEPEPGVLLVQTAAHGSLTDNGDGTFALVLVDLRTITWFADRPERSYGNLSLDEFVAIWQSDDVMKDPPNASLEIDAAAFPMELVEMSYEAGISMLTYRVRQLDESGSGSNVEPQTLSNLAFGPAALFIDGIPTSVNPQITD